MEALIALAISEDVESITLVSGCSSWSRDVLGSLQRDGQRRLLVDTAGAHTHRHAPTGGSDGENAMKESLGLAMQVSAGAQGPTPIVHQHPAH